MFNLVKIGDKEVPMLAMASVDLYYKSVFHEDPVTVQTKMGEGEAIGFFQRMGFIMAKFAELKDRKEMLKLNEDSYLEWLDQFERTDFLNALVYARMTYEGQTVTMSDAKKNTDAPVEK